MFSNSKKHTLRWENSLSSETCNDTYYLSEIGNMCHCKSQFGQIGHDEDEKHYRHHRTEKT